MKTKSGQMRELAALLFQYLQKQEDIKRQIKLVCRKIVALNYDVEKDSGEVEDE